MRLSRLYPLSAIVMALWMGPLTRLSAQGLQPDSPRVEELRRRVRQRFAQRVQAELRLTDEQMRRLRATVSSYGERRRQLEADQRTLRRALADQLQPGIAAQPDSVARLADVLARLRVDYAETFRAELREMSGYLDPVQRARIVMLRERLLDRGRAYRRRPFVMGPPSQ